MFTKICAFLLHKSPLGAALVVAAGVLSATMAMPSSLLAAENVPLLLNSPPCQILRAPAGDASVAGVIPTPLAQSVTSITLGSVADPANLIPGVAAEVKEGQLLIANVMTYSGASTAIDAPAGWELIRDDVSPTTRQTLYSHVAVADEQPSEWKFNQAVDAQGVIVVLDNAAATKVIDASSGIGGSQSIKAPALTTTDDGDIVLAFFSTDFGGVAPDPTVPPNLIGVTNQRSDTHAYWVVGGYQPKRGDIDEVDCPTPQLYNATAAQVAVRRR